MFHNYLCNGYTSYFLCGRNCIVLILLKSFVLQGFTLCFNRTDSVSRNDVKLKAARFHSATTQNHLIVAILLVLKRTEHLVRDTSMPKDALY